MKKFDFYAWLVTKDELIISLVKFVYNARRLWGWGDRRARRDGRMMLKDMSVTDKSLFIALNGPSIKRQPLERVKGMDCIFVNQGFRLPQYRLLHPRFHIFIDTKLVKGVWDIKWIDEILKMVPDITFVMPTSWSRLAVLKPYVDRGVRILWWDAPSSAMTHGVSGFAFQLAWRLGYTKIYFSGYEQTATPAYILKQASHFYGNDPDVDTHDAYYIMKDLSMNARHLAAAFRSSEYAKRIGVKMYNLTEGGIMDMFERRRFEDVFPA